MNYNNENIYAVCCITNYSLEKDYIEEWCEHYFNIGFNLIYMIDDAKFQKHLLPEIPYIKSCIDSGKIKYIVSKDHTSQQKLYESFYKEHGNEFLWCGIFDTDEFLTLMRHSSIQDLVNDEKLNFSNTDVIQFCWREFGDDEIICKQDKPVKETFKKIIPLLKNDGTIECKVLIHGGLKNVEFMIGHCAVSNKRYDRIKFCDGSVIGKKTPFHTADYAIAALDHYVTKTIEEYAYRKSHGRLDVPDKSLDECMREAKNLFFRRNKWSIEKENKFNEVKHKLFPKKKVIYTVIVNDYDELRNPKVIDNDYDYICFTDNPKNTTTVWEMRLIPSEVKGSYPKQLSAQIKICPHRFLKEYDESVYVDGNAEIEKSISELSKKINSDNFWLSLKKHPSRNCIYDEVEACLKMGVISQKNHDETLHFLQNENCPKEYGLSETNIIFRKHNNPKCISLMEMWIGLFMESSERTRDQFYLSYCIWKNNVLKEINVFDYNYAPWFKGKNAYVLFMNHNRKIKIYTTYYKETQKSKISNNSLVIPYNTNSDEFPTNVLNKYWSEYIVMKNIWLKGKNTDYIGFDQYDVHFPYDDVKNILSQNRIIFYSKMNVISPYKHFISCHADIDINNAIDIINEKYGKENKYTKYLYESKTLYYKSCFIMSWENFDKMADFIFSILDSLDKKYELNYDIEKYKELYQKRVDDGVFKTKAWKTFDTQCRGFGYLAERLMSAWLWVNIPHDAIITISDGNYKKFLSEPPISTDKKINNSVPEKQIPKPITKNSSTVKTIKRRSPTNGFQIVRSLYNQY